MLEAIIGGMEDPVVLARLARGRLRKKEDELTAALLGLVQAHQRFLLKEQLEHVDELDRRIEKVSREIGERLASHVELRERLDTIPGVGERVTEIVVCEVGDNVERFPTAGQFASWAGLSPGMNKSAEKNRSRRTPRGNRAVVDALVQAAHAAGRTDTYLGAQYRRLRVRIGGKKAAVAVAHSIAVIMYHLIQRGTDFHDLGPNYFEPRDRERAARSHVRRLEKLGYTVALTPAAA